MCVTTNESRKTMSQRAKISTLARARDYVGYIHAAEFSVHHDNIFPQRTERENPSVSRVVSATGGNSRYRVFAVINNDPFPNCH